LPKSLKHTVSDLITLIKGRKEGKREKIEDKINLKGEKRNLRLILWQESFDG
jgi:hypothetical protein